MIRKGECMKNMCVFFLVCCFPLGIKAQITEVVDINGDGSNMVDGVGLYTDHNGNLYVTGANTDNVIRVESSDTCSVDNNNCVRTEIIDATGDGVTAHDRTAAVAVDSHGHVYVVGQFSDNVWRIQNPSSCSTSGSPCVINEIISPAGDGTNTLDNPFSLVIDDNDNVYVAGFSSNNVFRITASQTCSVNNTACEIKEVMDEDADGTHMMSSPSGLAIDGSGNVFVTTQNSDNVYKIDNPSNCSTAALDTPCSISEILDSSGDGSNSFKFGRGIVVDSLNNVYVASFGFGQPARIFKINTPTSCNTSGPACTITELYEQASPQQASNMAVDDADNIYFAGGNGDNAFRIDNTLSCGTAGPLCTITEIVDMTGDGSNNLDGPGHVVVANDINVYVSGGSSDNVFRLSGAAQSLDLIFRNGFE